MIPIIGRAIGQPQCNLGLIIRLSADAPAFAKFPRRSPVGGSKGIIEAPDAAETGSKCNIRDRQVSVIQEALCKV
jgi:hypothetical protein